jgi:C4-dicarboxylate-specific signal transduction histidine kinase
LERKRAFAEHRRLEEEVHQIARVATMGELTAALSHELNQPLGAILNNARAARRLLASTTPDLAEIDSALEDIIATMLERSKPSGMFARCFGAAK